MVLSCCHGAIEQIRIEGVIGIAQAFLGSGARSMLGTRCGGGRGEGGGGHEAQSSVSLIFLQHFEVFCDLFLYRPTGTLNRFVLYDTKKQNTVDGDVIFASVLQ